MSMSQHQFHIQSLLSSMAEICFHGLYIGQCLNETRTETSQKKVHYGVPRLLAVGKSLLPKCFFCRLLSASAAKVKMGAAWVEGVSGGCR